MSSQVFSVSQKQKLESVLSLKTLNPKTPKP